MAEHQQPTVEDVYDACFTDQVESAARDVQKRMNILFNDIALFVENGYKLPKKVDDFLNQEREFKGGVTCTLFQRVVDSDQGLEDAKELLDTICINQIRPRA